VRISVSRIRIAMASVARRTAAIPQIWAAGRADARASPA
jgi:hypothetical protein